MVGCAHRADGTTVSREAVRQEERECLSFWHRFYCRIVAPRCPAASTVLKVHEAIRADSYLAPRRGLPGWCGLLAWIKQSVQKLMCQDHALGDPYGACHPKCYSAVTYKA